MSGNNHNNSHLELVAVMTFSEKLVVLRFESSNGESKSSHNDDLETLTFPVPSSMGEDFRSSPERHENETDWNLEEGDNFEIIR